MEAKGNGVSGVQRNVDKGIDTYSKTAHQAVDRAAEAASSVASRLGEHVDSLSEKGDQLLEMKDSWIEGARDYVREKPFAALGIAVAAGYILSMMMRSSK
jgi:ElaB/YqjD/DUF883 family membrane-anchored ribosome-binding protein